MPFLRPAKVSGPLFKRRSYPAGLVARPLRSKHVRAFPEAAEPRRSGCRSNDGKYPDRAAERHLGAQQSYNERVDRRNATPEIVGKTLAPEPRTRVGNSSVRNGPIPEKIPEEKKAEWKSKNSIITSSISAGAYTAGVLDSFFQALSEWDDHRKENGVSQHWVVLKVVAGAVQPTRLEELRFSFWSA
jgi:hypothetical protein